MKTLIGTVILSWVLLVQCIIWIEWIMNVIAYFIDRESSKKTVILISIGQIQTLSDTVMFIAYFSIWMFNSYWHLD